MSGGEPAAVVLRQPLGSVVRAFLVSVHRRRGEREIVQGAGEASTYRHCWRRTVRCRALGGGDDVLDVGFRKAAETCQALALMAPDRPGPPLYLREVCGLLPGRRRARAGARRGT